MRRAGGYLRSIPGVNAALSLEEYGWFLFETSAVDYLSFMNVESGLVTFYSDVLGGSGVNPK